jgi:hypothetical protein
MATPPPTPKGERGKPMDVFMMVRIKAGTSERFRKLCRPLEMDPPTKVHLNNEEKPCVGS